MENDKEFAQGIYVGTPKQDFILFELGLKLEEFLPWIKQKAEEYQASGDAYLNIQFKNSRAGKPYAEVNNYGRDKTPPSPTADINVPFGG